MIINLIIAALLCLVSPILGIAWAVMYFVCAPSEANHPVLRFLDWWDDFKDRITGRKKKRERAYRMQRLLSDLDRQEMEIGQLQHDIWQAKVDREDSERRQLVSS